MSLEAALEKLAEAINNHAEAVKLAATHSIVVSPTEIQVSDLTKAVEDAKAGASTDKKADKKADKPVEEKGPFYWANNANDHFGKVATKAELEAKKEQEDGLYLIPESVYKEKVAELKKRNEAAAAAKKAAEEAEAAAAAAAAAAEEEDDPTAGLGDDPIGGGDELHQPTLDEYKAAWGKFLEIDDEEVRKDRLGWTKQLLAHRGAKKATLVEEEFWAPIYKAIVDGAAGEDLPDPTSL